VWQKHRLDYANYYKQSCDYNYTVFLEGVQPNDASVFYDIQCLEAIHATAELEAAVSCDSYVFLKGDGKKVNFVVPASSKPEMGLEKAEQILTFLESDRWTLETLREKIPKECKSAINSEESCPDIEAGYLDVIKVFEV
jgi:hypothetical protein